MSYKKIFITCILITASATHAVKPEACDGVSQQCSKDARFDKTIEGQAYSCYECKQTVCKSGGSGPIAGTETSTVCESKTPAYRSLIQSQQTPQFDEADAVFGHRTAVKGAHPKPTTTESMLKNTNRNNTNDHRKNQSMKKKTQGGTKGPIIDPIIAPNNRNSVDHRTNKPVEKEPTRGTKGPTLNPVVAPSQVTLYDVTNNQLNISWMDNSNNEYGVAVERGMPEEDRGGINFNWQHVFNVEERIDSNIKATGWRTDGDDGLAANTEYCYRLRAYHQAQFSPYSAPVCTTTRE